MNHLPRKRFGQHFLIDQQIIAQLIRVIQPRAHDRLIEIGPGRAALTQPLLAHCDHLQVVELDRDLIPQLMRLAPAERLTIHQGDALNFDFAALASADAPLRIVGNLPYNISTPLIFHLLASRHVIRDMHFMLQQEVVDRLVATPGSSHWGRLGIMVQLYCDATPLFSVPPGAFDPPPKVESAVVRLQPHTAPRYHVTNLDRFTTLVTAAFQQRRKTLRNALRLHVTPEGFSAANIDSGRRPETLSIAEFVALSQTPQP
jgi:16S rRNA (adenine1518-N6/adenine1519-N6)-dimethyltransferase